MKKKNSWKRLWTMDVHNHEGFTLVELIIVIAILAILSGVAVVGYSAYVKKANMQADQTLASEVANALQLYYYNSMGTQTGAYVILKADGDAQAGGFAAEAMEAAYGSSWTSNLKLKYNGWEFDANLFKAMCNITGGYASSVNGSFVSTGTDKLLSDAQNCTNDLANLLASDKLENLGWTPEYSQQVLNELITGDANGDAMAILGDMNWDGLTSEEKANILSNATVFGIASELSKNPEETVENFGNGYYVLRHYQNAQEYFGRPEVTLTTSSPMVLTELANTYAALEALVAYMGDDEVSRIFGEIDTTGTNAGAIIDSVTGACNDICHYLADMSDDDVYEKFCAYYGLDEVEPNGMAAQDGEAYLATMQTVNGLSGDYKNALSTEDLFTSAEIADRVDSFLAATASAGNVADLSQFPELQNMTFEGSTIIVVFTADENGRIGCSILFCDN